MIAKAEQTSLPLSNAAETNPRVNKVKYRRDDSPEALVRNDTLWINCLRVFFFAILVVVAVGMSGGTYKVLSKLEYDKYRSEFERISNQLSNNFLNDLRFKILTARAARQALVNTSDGHQLDLNVQFLDDLSAAASAVSVWDRINWSPLLWNQTEREQFEAYAIQVYSTNNSVSDASSVCYVCGPGMQVGSPANIVNLAPAGSFSCAVLQQAGLGSYIPAIWCTEVSAHVQTGCQCEQAPTGNNTGDTFAGYIFRMQDGKRVRDNGPFPMSPVWESVSAVPVKAVLFNQMNDYASRQAITTMIETSLPTFSETRYPDNVYEALIDLDNGFPKCSIYYPVFGPNNDNIVGSVAVDFTWELALAFADNLPVTSSGIYMVLDSNQGQSYTFQIKGTEVTFVGPGDLHDKSYDSMMAESTFETLKELLLKAAPESYKGGELPETATLFNLRSYPSEAFKSQFITRTPGIVTTVVASVFVFTSITFLIFDVLVRRRQTKVMQSALQTNEIVTSIFPDFIKSRLIANTQSSRISRSQNAKATHNNFHLAAPKQQIRNMLGRKVDMANIAFDQSEPIADFFPNVTVIFADIAGFTAWSSEREPTQVFQLLESVYQTFDQIAEKHGVFKVETIGDCYVAVTGLPEPQTDHAVRMAKFAHEIMLHMHEAAVSLESQLGPGTGSLSIRVGMHSGSVTGGVLRGDKARFQLFGDTMNTAARMQTTGQVNKIQVSQTTAALLDDQCSHWLTKRDRKVSVKGKGDMQTFWVDPTCLEPSDIQTIDPSIPTSVASGSKETPLDIMATRQQAAENSVERLVDWNADLLERFLKNVVANRKATRRRQQRRRSSQLGWVAYSGKQPIDDVTEVIAMSDFCAKKADEQAEPTSVELSETVRAQLKDYVRQIAAMYRDNPFHNFEHASHVAMSANKIIKRIVRPDDVDYNQENVRKKDRKKTVAQQIHQSTFGISSDALMQFAVAFSAIIHDVDHTGVSNAQLVKENDEVAIRYDGKCVAEQHSVHVAWELLKKEQFSDFRACIYDSDEEKLRFRQLIVNAVIATDIADRDNQMLRKNRWNKAFSESSTGNRGNDAGDDISCKATVVFEYIIQASDVAHTMQHWHVYNQWNERLFEERYKAFLAGREEKDPSLGWYNGEIWFFDNYIIPLARKLETCGVFGVSSEEYLNYALENRHEWELKGHEIVQNLIEKYTVDRVVDALDIV